MGSGWDIGFARTSDDIDVAYATSGEGTADLILIHGFTTHLDLVGDSPWHAHWTRRMGEHFRVIQLDKRGTGLSDRTMGNGSVEDRMRDVIAVMDAVGSERASVVGVSEGGPIGLTFAATYPERVERLVLYGTMARVLWAPDYPFGIPSEVAEQFVTWIGDAWGNGEAFATFFLTHAPDTEAAIRLMAKFERNACTRQMAVEILRRTLEIDVRALLPGVSVPTLVVHNVGDPLIPIGCGRYLAGNIAGAEYEEGPGEYHCTWAVKEFEPLMERILGFLGVGAGDRRPSVGSARRSVVPPTRIVSTILFTDIVGSTDHAAAMGDERWGALLGQHHEVAAEATLRAGGRVIKSTGDGVLAMFDGPSRAIQAAHDLRAGLAPLGLEVRAGVHTGEVERSADDVSGIGVHIAARVMALAGPCELLATRTVRDLTAGSGIEFADRGAQVLKGIPGEWDLYSVQDRT